MRSSRLYISALKVWPGFQEVMTGGSHPASNATHASKSRKRGCQITRNAALLLAPRQPLAAHSAAKGNISTGRMKSWMARRPKRYQEEIVSYCSDWRMDSLDFAYRYPVIRLL